MESGRRPRRHFVVASSHSSCYLIPPCRRAYEAVLMSRVPCDRDLGDARRSSSRLLHHPLALLTLCPPCTFLFSRSVLVTALRMCVCVCVYTDKRREIALFVDTQLTRTVTERLMRAAPCAAAFITVMPRCVAVGGSESERTTHEAQRKETDARGCCRGRLQEGGKRRRHCDVRVSQRGTKQRKKNETRDRIKRNRRRR